MLKKAKIKVGGVEKSYSVSVISAEGIESRIYIIRGQKVMISFHLAELYKVKTKALIQAVKRNIDRFPDDFMFLLTRQEVTNLIFQNGTSSWGGTRKQPRAFTEQGVAMLSSILRSKKAVRVNIVIMRAFVKLREILSTHKELAHKLKELEGKIEKHDSEIVAIFDAIRQLMAPPPAPPKPKIGFHP